MVALRQTETDWSWPEATPSDQSAASFLNHLRFAALSCRAKARTDLFQACALLAIDRNQSLRAHAEALMMCLNEAIGTRTVLYRPGTDEHSFDEAWLLRLATALSSGDEATTAFLLRSRVAREHHRHISFLLRRISDHFTLI